MCVNISYKENICICAVQENRHVQTFLEFCHQVLLYLRLCIKNGCIFIRCLTFSLLICVIKQNHGAVILGVQRLEEIRNAAFWYCQEL